MQKLTVTVESPYIPRQDDDLLPGIKIRRDAVHKPDFEGKKEE